MTCPNGCPSPLVMTDRMGIEIDYCPTCRGVWLDKGELDKFIEKASAQMAPMGHNGPRPYDYDDDDGRRYGPDHAYGHQPPYRKKKKGFLSDMFDFD